LNAQAVNSLKAHPASETRSVGAAISETAGLALGVVLLLFVPFAIIGALDSWGAAVDAASSAGEALIPHVGWALTGDVTVLLGFYLVVLGGQILDGGDAARTRRVLGVVAESMAAASIGILALIVVHCVQTPTEWGVIVAVVPMVLIIVFLAVQVGRFLILDREQTLTAAVLTRNTVRRRLRMLTSRSRRGFLPVFLANAGVAAGLGLLMAIAVGLPSAGALEQVAIGGIGAAIFVVLAGMLFGWITFATYMSELEPGWYSRSVFIALSVFVLAVVVSVCVLWAEAGFAEISWGAAVVCAATTVLAVCPPPSKRPRLADWSFRASIRTLLARRLAKTYARSVREIINLRVPRAAQTLIQRFRTWLSSPR
jgi:hypothetical protein